MIMRKPDGGLKLQVYCKQIHTNQYLSFHPLHQKLGVIRTLFERCFNIVTEDEDKKEEEEKVKSAMKVCGYLEWSFEEVREKMEKGKEQKKMKNKKKDKTVEYVPYV